MLRRIKKVITTLSNSHGYSLVELAISTSIIAMLAVGGLSVLEKKNNSDRIELTKYRLTAIDNALKSFIQVHGNVPCPAPPTLRESQGNFGKSINLTAGTDATINVNGNTRTDSDIIYNHVSKKCDNNGLNNETGMVPVRTLNLADEFAYDGWGRKLTYRSASGSGVKSDFKDPSFRGNIRIADLEGTPQTNYDNPPPNNEGAIYVIISHGANGREVAWRRNFDYSQGSSDYPKLASGYERSNTDHAGARIYIQDEPTEYYDDIVIYGAKEKILPLKQAESPIRIDSTVCENSEGIISTTRAQMIKDLTNDQLASSLFDSAKMVSHLCHNAPKIYKNLVNPSNIPSLVSWFDASDTQTLFSNPTCRGAHATDDNPLIGCWKDKSQSGNHALQVSSKPSIQSSGMNRNPSVSFNGNNFLYLGGNQMGSVSLSNTSLQTNPNDQYSLFIVGKTLQDGTFLGKGGATKSNASLDVYVSDTGSLNVTVGGTQNVISSRYDKKPFILAITWNGINGKIFYKDSMTQFDSSSVSATLSNVHRVTLGAVNNGESKKLNGHISEIMVFDRTLSENHMKGLKAYLANKWNIGDGQSNVSCPADMEYKRTDADPIGGCHCPNDDQRVIHSISNNSACLFNRSQIGRCGSMGTKPHYDMPPRATNLSLWLDAADCTTISLTNNADVIQWRDKSHNQNHARSGTLVNPPKYRSDRLKNRTNHPLPYVEFDASNSEYLTLTSQTALQDETNANKVSLYAVVIPGDMTMRRSTIFSTRYRETTDDSWQIEIGGDNSKKAGAYVTGLFNSTPTWNFVTNNDILHTGVPYIIQYIRSDTTQQLFINGQDQTPASSVSVLSASFVNHDDTTKIIGAGAGLDSTHMYDGGIGELIVFSATHSQPKRNQIQSYLTSKWNIPTNIPPRPSPGSISTRPMFWYDANDPAGDGSHPSEGSTINVLQDLGEQNKDAISRGAGTPIIQNDVTNGNSVIKLSAGQFYDIADGNSLENISLSSLVPNEFSLFTVMRINGPRDLFGNFQTNQRLFGTLLTNEHLSTGMLNHDFTSMPSTNNLSHVNYHIISLIGKKNDALRMYVNGRLENALSTQTSTSLADGSFSIGRLSNLEATSNRGSGILYLGEFIGYQNKLCRPDRIAIEDYLSDKWGVPINR